MNKKCVYAGTFDPVTTGHIDIIERASRIYDTVYVVIGINPGKKALFTIEERIALLKESTKHLDHVIIDANAGLTMDYAKKVGADSMIRGLRATVDFEYELQLASCNQYLDDNIETVFLMTRPEYSFISSSNVKEIASNHHSVKNLVPECVEIALKEKYQ